jgi:hypothetical protein
VLGRATFGDPADGYQLEWEGDDPSFAKALYESEHSPYQPSPTPTSEVTAIPGAGCDERCVCSQDRACIPA